MTFGQPKSFGDFKPFFRSLWDNEFYTILILFKIMEEEHE